MNKILLQRYMRVFGDTSVTLAAALGISKQRLSAKLNGYKGAQFNQSEIGMIIRRYDLKASTAVHIFFGEDVRP